MWVFLPLGQLQVSMELGSTMRLDCRCGACSGYLFDGWVKITPRNVGFMATITTFHGEFMTVCHCYSMDGP